MGTSSVTCTATDAQQRSDSCSFTVTVQPPPRISKTRYVAFGDSITEGLSALGFALLIPSPLGSYPAQLQALLSSRYTAQSTVVLDEGRGGEKVTDGMLRLPGVLTVDAPEVLLLLEGVNDVNSGGSAAIPGVVNGLRAMVREARSRGIQVFLGTLLPQRPGGSRTLAPTLIAPTNDQIRAIAASEGAILVDLYQDFGGDAGSLIGDDGLHPNGAGYQKMAESFFAVIRARLEAPQSVLPVRSR